MRSIFLFPAFLIASFTATAQPAPQWDAAAIYHHMQKLGVMGSVLYVAAHPDDENTRLITWLANEKMVDAAYISLTRGDGGQNLIGSEFSEELGLIRTHELLEARKIDGGKQFFSRALDFGFSKVPTETFKKWNRKKILGDLLWIVRRMQPDIIITRFNTEPGKTHGHHTASAILANEVFEIGNDTNEYYEQLRYVSTWKPHRVLWNTSSFFFDNEKDFKKDTFLQIDVGGYSPLLGTSYTEIAALSRSKHKSQGFGSMGSRGEAIEYLVNTNGPKPANGNIFEGIDMTWNRVEGGKKIGEKIAAMLARYNMSDPSASVPQLMEIFRLMEGIAEPSPLVERKKEACRELIRQCMGLFVDVYTDDYIYAIGDTMRLKVDMISRNKGALSYLSMTLDEGRSTWDTDFLYNRQVTAGEPMRWTSPLMKIHDSATVSNPVWWNSGSLQSDSAGYIHTLESDLYSQFRYRLQPTFGNGAADKQLFFTGTIAYRRQDPVKGEVHKPVYIAPPVTATLRDPVLIFAGDEPKTVSVLLKAFKPGASGSVHLELPAGWRSEPVSVAFDMKMKREEQAIRFSVFPPQDTGSGTVKVVVETEGKAYSYGYKEIAYDHIPALVIFPEASCRIVRLGLEKNVKKIAYIEGAGDEVAQSLRQAGYEVDLLSTAGLKASALNEYGAVILGIRAYNTLDDIGFVQRELLKYAEDGGNVIVQYITTAGQKITDIGPYKLKIGRERVTEEDAEMRLLQPHHPVFTTPNTITATDFDGWVQERGLYFASEWDAAYTPLVGMNDTGEKEKQGALLVAPYGKGNFIYTGMAFFRQLPAGVPGAYKLFVNLIEYRR